MIGAAGRRGAHVVAAVFGIAGVRSRVGSGGGVGPVRGVVAGVAERAGFTAEIVAAFRVAVAVTGIPVATDGAVGGRTGGAEAEGACVGRAARGA